MLNAKIFNIMDKVIESNNKVDKLKNEIRDEKKHLILLNYSLDIALIPGEETLSYIENLIDKVGDKNVLDKDTEYFLIKAMILSIEKCSTRKPSSFKEIVYKKSAIRKLENNEKINKFLDMIDSDIKNLFIALEFNSTPIKRRNIAATILCCKWDYSKERIASLLSVKPKRIDDMYYDTVSMMLTSIHKLI